MGIVTRNPYTDFVFDDMDRHMRPASKRQRVVYQGPWAMPSYRTRCMFSAARDLEYKRLRKERLSEGFYQWRKLVYVGYPQPRPIKLIDGLKELGKEVRLLREKEKLVLAANRDIFADRLRADENAGVVEEPLVVAPDNGYLDLLLIDY